MRDRLTLLALALLIPACGVGRDAAAPVVALSSSSSIQGSPDIGCKLKITVPQTIQNDESLVFLSWDAEDYDPAAMHDNLVDNKRVKILEDGKYQIHVSVEWLTLDRGMFLTQLFKNGNVVLGTDVRQSFASTIVNHVFAEDEFVAGDYVQVLVFQRSGMWAMVMHDQTRFYARKVAD